MKRPALLLALLGVPAACQSGPRLLDDFSRPGLWRAQASDGVAGTGAPFEGGLRLDYDFTRGSGYAFLRRELPLDLPDNFELRFRIRGQGPPNALEVKLVDSSGENVWWHRRADFVPPNDWTVMRIRRRQIEFAWGPARDRTLRRTAAIEFVVAAGSGGGRGWIAIDDLEIVPLPVPPAVPPPVIASAEAGEGAALAVDGDPSTAWTATPGDSLVLDLGHSREFGGLVLRWLRSPYLPATAYAIDLSADGTTWSQALSVRDGDGATDWLQMPDSEARYVRIRTNEARDGEDRLALTEVEVRPVAFGASLNALVAAVAAEESRGFFPRGFIGEQNYWTLVATPEGGESGLIDEDGAIEVGRGGFSIEPVVMEGDRQWRWSDTESVQSLRDGDLPIPTVERRGPGWRLTITAIPEQHRLVARYRLSNDGAAARTLRLMLNLRPFQVNPPQQFLNITGGVSPIRSLSWDGRAISVNGVPRIWPDTSEIRFHRFDSGPVEGVGEVADDPSGLASGWLDYSMTLQPGEARELALSLGLDASAGPLGPDEAPMIEEAAAARWREALGDVRITGPAAAQPAFATLRTALAHVLATREGPALRPGSRAYARAWIRDGAMMSTALLRMGVAQPAIDFLEYYAPYQYPDGKVPCCVDARGADPVPEHDSHGELIHLVAQVHRYAPDRSRLERLWPRVRAAAAHIETLRGRSRIAENRVGDRRPLYGLLPPSISHEGYSARPAWSYWDDFWALTGIQDAAWLAGELGLADEASRLEAEARAFRADILASLEAARAVHGIDFMPGAADLGDFDATSTTVALAPAGLQPHLPRAPLEATFRRYWEEFVARRDGRRDWDAYTPYEWRNVGAFVRLGWRDRVEDLFDFFMADRRPAAWNQWAEVVGREPRAPRFIGDMPHGWVASDYINALLDMLVYERAGDQALVLGAGLPDSWLEDGGIAVERLRTPYGPLDFALRREGGRLRVAWHLDGRAPPGGLVLGVGEPRPLPGLSGEAEFER